MVTFAFSEAPGASFTESDIQVSTGLKLVGGSLTMVDATHYAATVTAADGFTGNATVSLAAGSYTDAALNLGGAGSDFVSIDTGNDPPFITAAVDSGTVTEGPLPLMITVDSIRFGDVDLTDGHVTAVTPGGIGYLGNVAACLSIWIRLANSSAHGSPTTTQRGRIPRSDTKRRPPTPVHSSRRRA